MNVLITGANGFIGKNLKHHLAERADINTYLFTKEKDDQWLRESLEHVDFIFHLAGINRPESPEEFFVGNEDLTKKLCEMIADIGKSIPIIFTSSIQAANASSYGKSKYAAEKALLDLQRITGNSVYIFRLPNVFGKWCKPNYNSVVATFCYNIARGMSIQINDPKAAITLVYIDDVIVRFIQIMDGADRNIGLDGFESISPQYTISIGELAKEIMTFKMSRTTLVSEPVGTGLIRALYSTYVSYLPTTEFSYFIPMYSDPRGVFVEMLKTHDSGQFSFFTAHPGITRGGHYHHSKTEKFLVIKGHARFKFRHIDTGDTIELEVDGEKSEIVETVPGWAHDITNIGKDELVVMLWANEIFDQLNPDTISSSL